MGMAKKFAIYCDTAGCGTWDEEDVEVDEDLEYLLEDWRYRGWEISEEGGARCEDCVAESKAD